MNVPEPVRPVLDPIDRLSELIFGLLMVLSFTGTISVAVGGAAISFCLLVIAATVPPSVSFLFIDFIDDLPMAMRVSNAVAVVSYSRSAPGSANMGRSPWPMALAAIGSALVAITAALVG